MSIKVEVVLEKSSSFPRLWASFLRAEESPALELGLKLFLSLALWGEWVLKASGGCESAISLFNLGGSSALFLKLRE